MLDLSRLFSRVKIRIRMSVSLLPLIYTEYDSGFDPAREASLRAARAGVYF